MSLLLKQFSLCPGLIILHAGRKSFRCSLQTSVQDGDTARQSVYNLIPLAVGFLQGENKARMALSWRPFQVTSATVSDKLQTTSFFLSLYI